MCILKESAVLVLSCNSEPLLPAGGERVARAENDRVNLGMITWKDDLLELNQTREKMNLSFFTFYFNKNPPTTTVWSLDLGGTL